MHFIKEVVQIERCGRAALLAFDQGSAQPFDLLGPLALELGADGGADRQAGEIRMRIEEARLPCQRGAIQCAASVMQPTDTTSQTRYATPYGRSPSQLSSKAACGGR